jgi:hypothetical protein
MTFLSMLASRYAAFTIERVMQLVEKGMERLHP